MTDKMPMDGIDEVVADVAAADLTDAPGEMPLVERPRDEGGRFAAREHGEAKGKPNADAARRREAAERDDARRERDELRRERDELRARSDALEKRWNGILTAAKGEEDQAPDPLAEISGKLNGIQERFAQQDQAKEAEETWRQVRAYSDEDERQFAAKTPDFAQAAQHFVASRIGELAAIGWDQGQIEQQLASEAQTLLINCAQRGTSPAQSLYEMAKARGYVGGSAPAKTGQQPAQNFGGRSFGTAAGAAGAGITGAEIGAMSDDEYMAYRQTPEGKRAIRAAQGGM